MRIIMLFTICLFFLSSCDKACLKSAGDEIIETRNLLEFNEIEIESHPIIHFIQDSLNFVEIKSRTHLIENIKTKVEQGVLKISNENKCKLVKGFHDTQLYIHFTDLHKISSNNSPEFYSKDTLYFNHLLIDIKGDLVKWDLKVKAEKMHLTMHSVIGEMKVSGLCNRLYLYTSGRNHCFFKDLECNFANINHTSVGDYYLTVNKSIAIDIHNYGDFYCYGNPETRIIKLDDYKTGGIFFFDE